MSHNQSEDAIDYAQAALEASDEENPIDLFAEFGCPAHVLYIYLAAEATPGTITVLCNARNTDRPNRADRDELAGVERTLTIRKSEPLILAVREIRGTTGIVQVRAQAPYRSSQS